MVLSGRKREQSKRQLTFFNMDNINMGIIRSGNGATSAPTRCAAGVCWAYAERASKVAFVIDSRASLSDEFRDRSTAVGEKSKDFFYHDQYTLNKSSCQYR